MLRGCFLPTSLKTKSTKTRNNLDGSPKEGCSDFVLFWCHTMCCHLRNAVALESKWCCQERGRSESYWDMEALGCDLEVAVKISTW